MCWFFFISLQLVEVNRKPRIKLSEDVEKVTIPGQKIAYRLYGHDGQYLINLNLTLHLHAIFQLKRIGSSQYPRIRVQGPSAPSMFQLKRIRSSQYPRIRVQGPSAPSMFQLKRIGSSQYPRIRVQCPSAPSMFQLKRIGSSQYPRIRVQCPS